MRELEKDGVIGELCDEFISTSGLANPLSNTRRMGREMADKSQESWYRRDYSHVDVRDEHAQRRCDHDGIGKGGYSDGANHFGSFRRENGRRESSGAWATVLFTWWAMPSLDAEEKRNCDAD